MRSWDTPRLKQSHILNSSTPLCSISNSWFSNYFLQENRWIFDVVNPQHGQPTFELANELLLRFTGAAISSLFHSFQALTTWPAGGIGSWVAWNSESGVKLLEKSWFLRAYYPLVNWNTHEQSPCGIRKSTVNEPFSIPMVDCQRVHFLRMLIMIKPILNIIHSEEGPKPSADLTGLRVRNLLKSPALIATYCNASTFGLCMLSSKS